MFISPERAALPASRSEFSQRAHGLSSLRSGELPRPFRPGPSYPLEDRRNALLKASFDRLFALLALVLTSPLLLLIALLIRLDSRGPVLYVSLRKGRSGKPFRCYKFRSMEAGSEDILVGSVGQYGDPRVTRVGKWLRRHSLDELPQFWNVLRGEMSVVGPKPARANLVGPAHHKLDLYTLRHDLKPGITGWAQVNGFRGTPSDAAAIRGRLSCDLWYGTHWTFWLDLRIIWRTLLLRKA
jgi:putative colanic acid biosynthesis UDP-glucose lipid carrier transferase